LHNFFDHSLESTRQTDSSKNFLGNPQNLSKRFKEPFLASAAFFAASAAAWLAASLACSSSLSALRRQAFLPFFRLIS